MSISIHFKRLGAPLANIRTSWGAVRQSDGTVFLAVWNGETRKEEGGLLSQLLVKKGTCTPERLSHVEMIRRGAPGFMVMRQGTNMNNTGGFNPRILWRVGELFTDSEGNVRCLIDGTVDADFSSARIGKHD